MLLCDCSRKRQAEACALAAVEELLEDVLEVFLRDPLAVRIDADADDVIVKCQAHDDAVLAVF